MRGPLDSLQRRRIASALVQPGSGRLCLFRCSLRLSTMSLQPKRDDITISPLPSPTTFRFGRLSVGQQSPQAPAPPRFPRSPLTDVASAPPSPRTTRLRNAAQVHEAKQRERTSGCDPAWTRSHARSEQDDEETSMGPPRVPAKRKHGHSRSVSFSSKPEIVVIQSS